MSINLLYFVLLGLGQYARAELNLQINKKTDDISYPVPNTVEENVGATFSLICELVSTANESKFDDHLSWVRDDSYASLRPSLVTMEINKSEKKFAPLAFEDRGWYKCVSDKFHLVKKVEVVVRNELRKKESKLYRDTVFCNGHMFQCLSSRLCILQHYVCDGKSDCKDESDESFVICGTNPCKDKIPCEDGRCIPSAWCCDRHYDPNCTVTNRPGCCQRQTDTYDQIDELGFPAVPQSQNTARYLFILVCVVSILFSVILLLLIISKVVIFAKKAALQQQQQQQVCENIALRNQTNINVIPCSLYAYRGSSRTPRTNNIVRNIIIDSSDVNDPLLFNPSRFNVINASEAFDQPPSYVDVLRNNRLVAEPPPPYRSQDGLDVVNSSQDTSRN